MRKMFLVALLAAMLTGCSLFDRITLPEGCAAFKITEISLLSKTGLNDVSDWACGQNWGFVMGEIMKKHPTMVGITDAKTCAKDQCEQVAKLLLGE